jgi:hypothetical protein
MKQYWKNLNVERLVGRKIFLFEEKRSEKMDKDPRHKKHDEYY